MFIVSSYDALYLETQIKLIKLIERYNFKIFYFTCSPITNLKIEVKDNEINLNHPDITNIKNNQLYDFYYIYEHRLCEIFYSFIKISNENVYYYNFLMVVKDGFNLEEFYKIKFKTIKIESVKEYQKNELTFELIENLFNQRILISNNVLTWQDKKFNWYYDTTELEYGSSNFIRNYKNGIKENYNMDEYQVFNSFYFHKKFNQDKYLKNIFMLICSQIWTADKSYCLVRNDFDYLLMEKEEYDLNSRFLTNFFDIIGCKSAGINDNGIINVKYESYTYCTLSENLIDQGIYMSNFNRTGFYEDWMYNTLPRFENWDDIYWKD